jgi:hypothetical protein
MTTTTVSFGQTVSSEKVASGDTEIVPPGGTAGGRVVYRRFDQPAQSGGITAGGRAFGGGQTVPGVAFSTVVDGLDGSQYVYCDG